MTGHLVDTQVLIWLAREPGKLGRQTSRVLRNSASVHFSSISFAELEIKQAVGKFTVRGDLRDRLVDAGLGEVPFTATDAMALRRFPALARHDPFDRFIMAQAAARGLNLITADRVMLGLGLPWVLDASV